MAQINSQWEKDTFIPYLDSICLFLVQVRMFLVVIGGEISSKMEMAFLFRNRDSSLWQSNVFLSPPKNKIVGFWSLEGIFKTLQQALHFLQS